MSKRLDSLSLGFPHRGQSLGAGLSCLRFPTTSRMFRSNSIGVRVAPLRGCFVMWLCDFDVFFWVAHFLHEVFLYPVSVVALE